MPGGASFRKRAKPALETDALRVPPHSLEAEQAVLGGLLLDNSAWDGVADRLHADDFYRRDHQLIFGGIAELAARSEPADAVTVAEYLAAKGLGEETGGLVYLGSLARDTPTAANVRAYAEIVRERSQLRQLIRVSGEIAASAYASEGRPATELVDDAERRVFEIAEQGKRTGSGFVPLRDVLGADDRPSRHAAPVAGAAHGREQRLYRSRQDDRRAAARRSRDRRRTPVHGQDDARAQHRGTRGDCEPDPGRRVQHGNVARAARVPHDFVDRSRRPESSAHRHVRRRGLGAHQ
jgi:hypothetical protein